MHKQDEDEFYNPREALRRYSLVSRLEAGPIIQPAISYTEPEDVDQSSQPNPSIEPTMSSEKREFIENWISNVPVGAPIEKVCDIWYGDQEEDPDMLSDFDEDARQERLEMACIEELKLRDNAHYLTEPPRSRSDVIFDIFNPPKDGSEKPSYFTTRRFKKYDLISSKLTLAAYPISHNSCGWLC
jgi:hypothetical protein